MEKNENNKEYKIKNDKDLRIKYDKDFDPLAKNLIEKILRMNPNERYPIEKILNHIFFEDVDLKIKNELFVNKKEEKIINEIKITKENISKEMYDKMVISMNEENKKIKKELEIKLMN